MDKLFSTVPLYLAMTRVELEMARKSPEFAVCPDAFPLAWTAMLRPVQRVLPTRVNGNICGEQCVFSWAAHKQTLTLISLTEFPGSWWNCALPLASPNSISQSSSPLRPQASGLHVLASMRLRKPTKFEVVTCFSESTDYIEEAESTVLQNLRVDPAATYYKFQCPSHSVRTSGRVSWDVCVFR